MTSDAQLRRWYLIFNRKWFKNELPVDPDDIVVYWEPYNTNDGLADCSFTRVDGTFVIRIDPCLKIGSLCYAKLALLHEMAHISTWKRFPKVHHGQPFQDEMLRLAKEGAFRALW